VPWSRVFEFIIEGGPLDIELFWSCGCEEDMMAVGAWQCGEDRFCFVTILLCGIICTILLFSYCVVRIAYCVLWKSADAYKIAVEKNSYKGKV